MVPSKPPTANALRWLPVIAGAVAFASACAVFWSFEHPWTLRGDNKVVMYPMNLDAFRAWMSGRVPEWSDGFWGGFPLLADPTSMSLYWPNFLFFFATPEPHLRAYDLATAFHSAILVSGVVSLLQLLGARPVAALLGGLLIFIAPMHVWFASSMITGYAPVAWWPWMLVAAERLSLHGLRLGSLVLGWVSLASCALVYPEFALYGGIFATLWVLTRNHRPLSQRIVCALLLGLGGIALAAPQVLPTALFVPDTTRSAQQIREFDVAKIIFSAGNILYPGTDEMIPSFIGVATLIIAIIGVRSPSPRVWFLAAVAAITFLLALGDDTRLYAALRSVPLMDMFRAPMKFKLLTELAVVLLAALGFDYMWRRNWEPVARRFALLLTILMLMEHVTYAGLRIPTGIRLPGYTDTSFAELYSRMRASGLARHAHSGPQLPVARVSERVGLRGLPVVEGVSMISGGANALLTDRHLRIVDAYHLSIGPTKDEMEYFGVQYDLRPDPAAGDRTQNPCLNIAVKRQLLVMGRHADTCLYSSRDRSSRFVIPSVTRSVADIATMVDTVVEELSGARVILAVPDPLTECQQTPRRETAVILERAEFAVRGDVPIVAPAEEVRKRMHAFGRVGVIDHQPGVVSLLTISNRPAFLLVKESYYIGWEATVDGEPAPIYPAAGLFFAVPIPSGEHEVHLAYRAPGVRTGVRVALTWIAATCFVELFRRVRLARVPALES